MADVFILFSFNKSKHVTNVNKCTTPADTIRYEAGSDPQLPFSLSGGREGEKFVGGGSLTSVWVIVIISSTLTQGPPSRGIIIIIVISCTSDSAETFAPSFSRGSLFDEETQVLRGKESREAFLMMRIKKRVKFHGGSWKIPLWV